MEQELAELRLSVLQGLCHNHGLNYTGLTKSQMAAIIAQHTRTHHPGQSDSDIVLELEREHSVSSLLTPQIGEELNLHLATSEDLEAEAAVQVASPDPLDDPIMDLYRSRLVILGADLTSAERLKLLELTMQESQGRTSHCWKAHQQGAGPEIPKHVVKLMHAAFPSFNEGKESIDAYLRTFEIMCEDYEVPKTEWTKILEAKLVGKARDVYRETPYTQQTNYDEVKGVLFNNYAISPETYLHTFRALTKDPTDTHWVFANCLQHTFDQWLKSSGVQSLEDLRQLCLMEQFLELCSPDIRKWVWDRTPDTLEEAARLADKYVESRGQLLQGLPVLTSLSTSAYTPKLSTGHSQTNFTSPSPNGIPAQDLHHRNKMCFRCGSDSHLQATCQLPPRASKLKQPQHVALVTTEMVETPFHPVQAVQHHTQDCASKNMLTSQPIGEYIVMGVQQADQMKHPRHAPTQESNLQNCNVYVGNLGQHGNKAVLEHAFGLYGPLRRIWVAQKPPGFAFVEFEDPHDAATAVQGLNGKTLCGSHVKVELSIRQRHSKHITMCQLAPETKNYRLNQNSSGFLNFSQSVTPSVCGPLPTEGSPINALPLGEEPCGCVKNIGGIDLMSF